MRVITGKFICSETNKRIFNPKIEGRFCDIYEKKGGAKNEERNNRYLLRQDDP